MMNDDEILTMLLALESDPAFKELMEDLEIMKRILSGDIHGLMSNPKFLKLLNNPTIQEIRSKIEEYCPHQSHRPSLSAETSLEGRVYVFLRKGARSTGVMQFVSLY
jgi:hypothetical protein